MAKARGEGPWAGLRSLNKKHRLCLYLFKAGCAHLKIFASCNESPFLSSYLQRSRSENGFSSGQGSTLHVAVEEKEKNLQRKWRFVLRDATCDLH